MIYAEKNYSVTMRRTLLALVPLFLILTGCAKPGAAFVGKWQFADTMPKTGDAASDAQVASQMSKLIIEIKADKTFSTIDKTGTYEVNGKTITLMAANPQTDDEKKPATATLSDDGKTLSFTFPGTPQPIKFAKTGA